MTTLQQSLSRVHASFELVENDAGYHRYTYDGHDSNPASWPGGIAPFSKELKALNVPGFKFDGFDEDGLACWQEVPESSLDLFVRKPVKDVIDTLVDALNENREHFKTQAPFKLRDIAAKTDLDWASLPHREKLSIGRVFYRLAVNKVPGLLYFPRQQGYALT